MTLAFTLELFCSFFLMYVVLKSVWDERVPKNIYGFVIAGYYAAISIAFARISGGSMNPARVVGPAVFSGQIVDLWIYIAGPIIGCILGSMFYRVAHLENNRRLAETEQQTDLIMLKPLEVETTF